MVQALGSRETEAKAERREQPQRRGLSCPPHDIWQAANLLDFAGQGGGRHTCVGRPCQLFCFCFVSFLPHVAPAGAPPQANRPIRASCNPFLPAGVPRMRVIRVHARLSGGACQATPRRCCTNQKPHPVVVIVDVKGLMRVDVDVVVVLGLLRRRAHEAPHWQVVDEQFVPARRVLRPV